MHGEHPLAARRVPAPLRLQALFGGAQSQFGWIFVGLGLLILLAFGGESEALTFCKYLGPLNTTTGTVTRTYQTEFTESKNDGIHFGADRRPFESEYSRRQRLRRHNDDVPVYAVEYAFTPSNGGSVTGTAYQVGGTPDSNTVTVQYKANNPQISRVKGLRTAPRSAWFALILLFPLIGVCLIVASLRRGRTNIALLRHGTPALATLVDVTRIDDAGENEPAYDKRQRERKDPQYEVTFAFTPPNGTETKVSFQTKTLEPAWEGFYRERNPNAPEYSNGLNDIPILGDMLGNKQTDLPTPPPIDPEGLRETVLYDPAHPAAAFIPAEFGESIRVDATGNLTGVKPATGYLALLTPALAILSIIWCIKAMWL